MRMRRLAGLVVALGFVGIVVHAAAASQCPAREPGACARVHAMLMQRPALPATIDLATQPMRASGGRG
jgi:hypothetical protein